MSRVMSEEAQNTDFAKQFKKELLELYGPTLTGKALVQVLGFPSAGALRQAVSLGKISVPIFTPENRRGQFALTIDVANWLAEERERAIKEMQLRNNE